MINFQRPDVYRSIHKALRKAMFEFSYMVGRTNYHDKAAVLKLKNQFDELVNLLHGHGEKEDHICLPLLESKRPGCTAHNEEEHVHINKVIVGLQYQMPGLTQYDQENIDQRSWAFYYAINKFIADYLMHMQLEEIEMTKLFYELCTDEEIAGMTEQILKAVKPEEMAVIAKHMLPALLPKDRMAMMKHIKDTAPAPAFEGMMQICKSVLSDSEYLALIVMVHCEEEELAFF